MIALAKTASPAAKAALRQATALRPNRNKASDGLLPSAAHQKQNPNSDHNSGFAFDITNDPAHDFDGKVLFEKLKADKRVKYLIHNGFIWSRERAKEGNRPYDGANPHHHHVHVSLEPAFGNDTRPWFPWLGKATLKNKVASAVKSLPKKEIR